MGLGEEVLDRLRSAIHDGKFLPGSHLVEDVLAETLGVSRGPVREALKELEREGLVVTQRNRGTFVARLTRQDMQEIYSIRIALERIAVTQAMRLGTVQHHDEMQRIIDQVAAADSTTLTATRATQFDAAFHDVIYRASGNKRLYQYWELLRSPTQMFLLSRNLSYPNFSEIFVPEHQRILDTLKMGDPARALEVIEQHMRAAYDEVLATFE